MEIPAVATYLTVVWLASTTCLFAEVATLTANKTTTEEPGREESLWLEHSRKKDFQAQQRNTGYHFKLKKHTTFPTTNNSEDILNNRKRLFQNRTIYRTTSSLDMKYTSPTTISRLKSRADLQSNTTEHFAPTIVTNGTITRRRKLDHKKERNVKSMSSLDQEDYMIAHSSNKAVDEQHSNPVRIGKMTGGPQSLNYESNIFVAPSVSAVAKAYFVMQDKQTGTQLGHCSCENTKCNFSYCNLTSVPENLNPNVIDLLLSGNKISILPSNAFSRYSLLEKLVVSANSISALEDGAFYGLSLLTYLDLSYNLVGTYSNLSTRIFEPLTSLKVLRMEVNGFLCEQSHPRPDVLLASLHTLEELYIDNYSDIPFGPGFRNIKSLRNLTLSCDCPLDKISNTTFTNLGQIMLLNIRNCGVMGIMIETGAFSHFTNLTSLDISHNINIGMDYLPMILWGLQNSNLETLRMDNIVLEFSINFINISLTQYLARTLTTLSARKNNIISIDLGGFIKLPRGLQFVDISDNYMIMPPANYPLWLLWDLETLILNTNVEGCLAGDQFVADIPSRQEFNFPQPTRNITRHERENKNGNSYQRQTFRIPGKLKHIRINVQNLHGVFLLNIDPSNSLEVMDLRCSVLEEIDFTSLWNFPKLRLINVGRSSIRTLNLPVSTIISSLKVLILESNNLNDYLNTRPAPFHSLQNLSHLDLSLNQISNLDTNLFHGLDNMEQLRLDGNTFSRFDANISNMRQLTLLNLSNTHLPNLPSKVRSFINHVCQTRPNQISVDMSGCPVQCDCFNLDFLKWMVRTPAFDKNFTGYKCRYSDSSVAHIHNGYKEIIADLDRECAKNQPTFMVVLAATLILLCGVTASIIYRFRWNLRYLYYAAYLKVMDTKKADSNHGFIYDVFISYDSEDQRFVTQHLCPELENRDLKVLIHTRDFVAGTYIASNIVMAVADSRKTLVVLTRNLLESTWCNYELQMATMEAVHTGRQVLMFLLKEDIPSGELDVELLRYIQTNTYLPYPGPEDEGDEEVMKRFYDKLAHDLKC